MAKANFLGVYSTRGVPGSVTRNAGTQRKQYWFIWHDAIARTYLAQQLNTSYDPVGEPQLLPPDMFRQSFTREPRVTVLPDIQPNVADYLSKAFAPDKKQNDTTLVTGAAKPAPAPISGARHPGDVPFTIPARGSASIFPEELDKALRAEFAMGIMRFRRGNKEGAIAEFRRLAAVSDGIVSAHKHMFTDFGKDLRKCQLGDLAIACFSRALELSPQDSHACFNLARAYYEMGKYQEACDYLSKALELEPDLKCACKLLEKTHIQMEAFIPEEF